MTARLPEDFQSAADDRLLPWRKVKDLTGISRTTAWRLQNAGDFPRPVVISPGRVGWREADVLAWKASLSPRDAPFRAPRSYADEPRPERLLRAPAKPQAAAPSAPGVEIDHRPRSRRSPQGSAAVSKQMTFDF